MVQEAIYVGQIMQWREDEIPKGWVLCDGQYLAKKDFMALFDLMGTAFGANATHFAVPDFSGKAKKGYHYIISPWGIYPNAAK
ncbi:MAG: tail fiber protein [Saprospiraceae bacterium]|nr:tail fiber protein [Saprospiraceae bacterium]